MAAVKGSGTGPEMLLRKRLWKRGLRYRLNHPRLPGKPDIVFVSARVAVFVDGDFWHGNQWRLRGFASLEDQLRNVRNRPYWEKKIKGNIERDRKVDAKLRGEGWKVIRIWESDLSRSPGRAVGRIVRAVEAGKRPRKGRGIRRK